MYPVKVLALLLLFIVPVAYSARTCDTHCGVKNDDARIVGGQFVTSNEHPWMCYFKIDDEFLCGCTLISDRFVLTAAHCVHYMRFLRFEEHILVHFGTDRVCNDTNGDDNGSKQVRGVVRIYSANFSSTNLKDDISMLQLSEPVQFTDNVLPIFLSNISKNFANKFGDVAGWGRISENGQMSCILKETELPILSNSDCFSRFRHSSVYKVLDHKLHICTLYDHESGPPSDACQSDSGGPLIYQREDKTYEQIGIVSWGRGCARENSPGIYTRVSGYIEWIKTIIEANDACLC